MILAIETSSLLCSVAFWENERVLLEYNHKAPMQHATLIGQLVDKGLKETSSLELEGVAVGIGPGSFTGLRIGLSYAQGFCYGRNIPIFGISNHQVLAMHADLEATEINTIIDARRDEVYLATHRKDGIFSIASHMIVPFDALCEKVTAEDTLIIHEGVRLAEAVKEVLLQKKVKIKTAGYSAAQIAKLAEKRMQSGNPDDLEKLEPMYIRPFAGVQ